MRIWKDDGGGVRADLRPEATPARAAGKGIARQTDARAAQMECLLKDFLFLLKKIQVGCCNNSFLVGWMSLLPLLSSKLARVDDLHTGASAPAFQKCTFYAFCNVQKF